MHEAPQPFCACLRDLMTEKKISISALTAAMGYASKTTVARVLHGEASVAYQADFLSRLIETDALQATAEETTRLQEALEVSSSGVERYLCNKAIAQLVAPDLRAGRQADIVEFFDSGFTKLWLLEELYDQLLRDADQVQVWMTGWGHTALMCQLKTAIQHLNPSQISIAHYLCCQGREFIEAMASIMPMIYMKCYQPWGLANDSLSAEAQAILRVSRALLRVKKGDEECYAEFRVLEDGNCEMVRFRDRSVFIYLMRALDRCKASFNPIKTVFELQGEPWDYLRYTEFYLHLESGHPAYILRYDVPIMFIHPDVLVNPTKEGFQSSGFFSGANLDEAITRFYGIQLLRWKAVFASDRPTHVVFSWKGMLRFARSGKASDQFFGIRPYNVTERLTILLQLRKQMVENPYFHLYFTPADSDMIRDEISYYEGMGLFLCKGETDYRLDTEHAEALITQQNFCDSFKSYFEDKLIQTHVVSPSKALQMMDDLISAANSAR